MLLIVRRKEVRPKMTIFESLIFAVTFASLVVTIVTVSQKK